MTLLDLLSVGAGGGIGAALRYLASGWAQRLDLFEGFPVGTLAVNLVGSVVLGLLAGVSESRYVFGPNLRLFLFIGLLGGFTTYSTFSFETFGLLREGLYLRAAANVTGTLVLCLVGVWLGYGVGTSRFGR